MTAGARPPELLQIDRSRRAFLSGSTVAAVSAVLSQGCGGPLITSPATTFTAGTFKLSDLPGLGAVGSIVRISGGGGVAAVAVVHTSPNTYAAYSMSCPHLGTTIDINADFSGFTCPNHGARFAASGAWIGGQVTNSLTALAVTYDAAAGTITIGGPITVAPAAIGLTPTTESFAATVGGSNPPAQTVAVGNTGSGTLAGLTVATVAYAAGQTGGWLGTPTLSGTTAPAVLALQPVVGALPAGLYNATVTVTSSDPSVSPASMQVAFTVAAAAAAPVISLATTTAAFAGVAAGANPSAQAINVTNSGGATLSGLTATVSSGASWLSASLSATTAPATLSLSANLASLAVGAYSATVTVASTVAGVAAKIVTVNLTVASATAAATLVLSATTKAFAGQQGGASPAAATINVQNGGGGTLSGLATTVAYGAGATGWLTATITPATAPAVLTLMPALGSLTAGTYTATVTVAATGVASQTVAVTFTVAGLPALTLSTAAVTFSSAAATNPAQQQVQVSNSGGGTLSGLTTAVAFGAGATGWLSATLTATSAPAAITLAATAGTLAAGTYTATVTVSAAGVTAKTIAVTYTIAPAGLAVIIANYAALATIGTPAGSVGTVQGTPTAVERTGANSFVAYSMRCPHQGTTVRIENWNGTGSVFHCPNHDAIFDRNGVLLPNSPQSTSNLPARTVTYTPGDTVLYIS